MIDGTSGDAGRIVWRVDPKQQKQSRNRGATMWGNLVVTAASDPPRIVATDKETGKVAWESSFADTPEVELSSAPLAIKDEIIVGAACGDQGVRDWIAGLDAKSGQRLWQKYVIPAPGEPGSETWKDKTTPGRPAAVRCGSPAPTMRPQIRRSGAPATPSRCMTRPIGLATTSTLTARSPGILTPVR
jgi:alcohol dehydrogenase (cytochrome c)